MLSLRYPASIVIDEEDYKDDPSMEVLLEKYRDYNRCELFHIDAVKIYVDYWTEERLCKLAILADKLGYRLFLHALKAKEQSVLLPPAGLHTKQTAGNAAGTRSRM